MSDSHTGYPWSTGDELFADDLNAAIVAASSAVAAGGPFLSLGGGTVTGTTYINAPFIVNNQAQSWSVYAGLGNTITFSGAQTIGQYGLLFIGNVTGSAASGANVNYVAVPTDTATLPANAQGLCWFQVNGNVGGAGGTVSGNRAGISSILSFVGPCGGLPSDRQWSANQDTFASSAHAGGTALVVGQAAGIGYAGSDQAWLHSGATNWDGLIGREIDVGIDAGASATRRIGLNIVSFSTQQGVICDWGIGISGFSSTGNPGFLWGIALTSNAIDPVNGRVLGYQPPVNGTGSAEAPPKAYRGIDLSQYLFSDSAFRATGGFVVDGAGAVNVSSAKLSVTPAGQAQLDVPGQAITAVAINNGGTGYHVGDLLRGPYGTVVTVSTIGAGGTITGITVNLYGGTTLASPSTTGVHFDGGAGAITATFNLTFTAAGGSLSLNPTGHQVLTNLSAATTDAAAAIAGVPVNGLYNNAGVVHVRLT